jgi:hypothetical protein
MKNRIRRLVQLCLVALPVCAASGCDGITLDQWPCPPGGTTLTYDNFGQGFFGLYCNSCHSSPNGGRNGAPDDYVFATHADVIAHKERIFAMSASTNDFMPPGPDAPPIAQRNGLADWLACGAP